MFFDKKNHREPSKTLPQNHMKGEVLLRSEGVQPWFLCMLYYVETVRMPWAGWDKRSKEAVQINRLSGLQWESCQNSSAELYNRTAAPFLSLSNKAQPQVFSILMLL